MTLRKVIAERIDGDEHVGTLRKVIAERSDGEEHVDRVRVISGVSGGAGSEVLLRMVTKSLKFIAPSSSPWASNAATRNTTDAGN